MIFILNDSQSASSYGFGLYHCHPIILLPNKGLNTHEKDQVVNLILLRTPFPPFHLSHFSVFLFFFYSLFTFSFFILFFSLWLVSS